VDVSQWQRVKELFGAALGRAPADRSAFLAEACGDNESLRQEVQSLLAEHQEYATKPAADGSTVETTDLVQDSLLDRRVGPYQVLRCIGQGGMATVYLAARADEEYKSRVAIKLLPPYLDDQELSRRFRNERQTLAALDHPNIVKLLDGGTTTDGRPYLVMDYVEGTPLDEYCDDHKLSIDQRLRIFLSVCAAVEYAHRRLVIHRDLKPGNILVRADGTAKLLDFGIAKLLNPEAAATLVVTRAGERAMTPEYASPEQIRGEPLTQATDIYSLGVILYKLLTGHRLYEMKTAAIGELERAICETEPLKPSTVVTRDELETLSDGSTKTITAEEISRTREGDPRKLSRLLHGDLDAIVLAALRKEPRRRYASVKDLAEDIRKHLEHLPITARPSTILYRARKFLRRHKEAVGAAVIALALSGLAIFGYQRFHRGRVLTDKDSIVLADFSNSTGDPVFDDALKQGLSVVLSQSPFLDILPDDRINKTLQLMGRAAGDQLTPDLAREVCLRNNCKVVLAGSIQSLGRQYVIGLKALHCSDGKVIAQEQIEAEAKEGVLKALDQASTRMREKLGESIVTLQKYEAPLAQATTSSLEALKAFSMGARLSNQETDITAIPFYQRATELDPNFAMAYASLGIAYGNIGKDILATDNIRKAYELRDRTSDVERYLISYSYYEDVTGELEKANRVLEEYSEVYPRNSIAPGQLASNFISLGQYDQAVAQGRESIRRNPNGSGTVYESLMAAYLALDRLDAASATYEQALSRKLESLGLHTDRYALAFLRGNTDEMQQQVSWAEGKPGIEDALLSADSDSRAYKGQFDEARRLSRRAADTAARNDQKEMAAEWLLNSCFREAEVGNLPRARQQVRSALKMASGRDVLTLAALCSARAEDNTRAQSIARDLNSQWPLSTALNTYWLPTIRAALELNRKQPGKAVEELQPTAAYEMGQPYPVVQVAGSLYPVYIRGEAYLKSGQARQAATEFQKIIDHRGIVVNFVVGALAYLQLGRAEAMDGDRNAARSSYMTFLTLWKAADSDVPILQQAKAEYAKLQ
jgi:eukaryotic-like serine/threonine-protein kinase